MQFIFGKVGVEMDVWKKSDWRKKSRVQMPDYQNINVLMAFVTIGPHLTTNYSYDVFVGETVA